MGKYNAATGLGKMYYTVLKEQDGVLTPGEIKDVDYVQELEIEFGEDLEKAYGSNKVAEIAKSAGETSLNLTFHKLPIDVQKDILGLVSHSEKKDVYGFSNGGGIDYVAVAIPRTMEDGSMEWFGLSQGVFTRPKKEGKTKEDKVEFGSDEIEGQFMERQIPGFEDAQSVIMAYEPKGVTEGRDTVFNSIFGKTLSTNEDQGQTSGSVTTPPEKEEAAPQA